MSRAGQLDCVCGPLVDNSTRHRFDGWRLTLGFAFAVFTNGDQSRGNNTHTDSYNSSVAPYAAGGCSGNVATNSSDNPAVTTGNPAAGVCGTINTGNGGTVGGSGSYTGPQQKHSTPLVLTPVVFPTLTASVAVTTFGACT